MSNYTDAELDAYERVFEIAANMLYTDPYFELILSLDPDQSIEIALRQRQDKAEAVRRAALSDKERAAEDAHDEQLIKMGMEIVRRKLAERR